jgi:hypothetical protein
MFSTDDRPAWRSFHWMADILGEKAVGVGRINIRIVLRII